MRVKQNELAKIIAEVVKETLGLDYSNAGQQKPRTRAAGAPVMENNGPDAATAWAEGYVEGVWDNGGSNIPQEHVLMSANNPYGKVDAGDLVIKNYSSDPSDRFEEIKQAVQEALIIKE